VTAWQQPGGTGQQGLCDRQWRCFAPTVPELAPETIGERRNDIAMNWPKSA